MSADNYKQFNDRIQRVIEHVDKKLSEIALTQSRIADPDGAGKVDFDNLNEVEFYLTTIRYGLSWATFQRDDWPFIVPRHKESSNLNSVLPGVEIIGTAGEELKGFSRGVNDE